MKKCLVVSPAGLAISFALPTYAQQKDLADPQTTQKLLAGAKADEEARNNNDPAAFSPLTTLHARRGFCYDRGASHRSVRDGMQTCCSSCTPKSALARWTGMPFT